MERQSMSGEVHIELSEPEAIVLFDVLHRLKLADMPDLHTAERQVLNGLECELGSKLVAVLRSDWSKLVEAAHGELEGQ